MVQYAGKIALKCKEVEFFQFFPCYSASLVKPRVSATILNTTLSSCINFRTYDETVSFHNKVVAEFGTGSKRSFHEFPFRCSYKKLPSREIEKYLQPLYKHGQGNGVKE